MPLPPNVHNIGKLYSILRFVSSNGVKFLKIPFYKHLEIIPSLSLDLYEYKILELLLRNFSCETLN